MLHCREWFYNFAIVINKQKTMENEFFAEVKTLKHGFNAKRIGYKWGLYNDEGYILMRPLYDYISIDQEGRIWARYKGKKFFVEDDKLPYPFDFIHDSEIDKEWYVIESNGCLGVMDKQLNIRIPLQYKYISDHGGVLWCSNDRIHRDIEKGHLDYLADCSLFSYKGISITEKKYDLHIRSYASFPIPSFPIIGNKDGFNILNNEKKVALSIPAKTIVKNKECLIIEYEKEQLLYSIKNNCFINKYKCSEIKQWKWNTNIFICKRLSNNSLCDVYDEEKLIASYNCHDYSLIDVADDFIIVMNWNCHWTSSNSLPKFGFINNKGLSVPCLYDRITCYHGAINIVKAEIFEELSKEYKENSLYVEYKSPLTPYFYVTKGRYDVFAFDGHCIVENVNLLKTSLLRNAELDSFFIIDEFRDADSIIGYTRKGDIKTSATQYDISGRINRINKVVDIVWSGFSPQQQLKIVIDGGSVISIPQVQIKENRDANNHSPKDDKKLYSAFRLVTELLSSDYCIATHKCITDSSELNQAKNEIKTCVDLEFCEGLSPIFKNGKWGYVNENGDTIIPFVYDAARPFSDGLAAVKKDRYFGFIDYNNKVVIDFNFIKVEPFNEGLAKFVDAFSSGYVSKDGCFVEITSNKKITDSESINYARDTWDAMTDGMYGDYPGSGVDYDTIGFGI